MSETPTGGLGERRRRREAERARRAAAAADQPMSRRERRALEEALASGAIRMTDSGYEPTGEFPTTTAGQHALTPEQLRDETASETAGPAETGEVERDADPEPAAEPEPETDAEPQQEAATQAEPADESEPAEESAPSEEDDSSDAAESRDDSGDAVQQVEPDETEPVPDDAAPQRGSVSRRTLRQQWASANAERSSVEGPSEQTGTGRRPVIRPPATARGVRGVDATGELTGIQRAVRDIDAAPEGESTSETRTDEHEAPTPPEPGARPGAAEQPDSVAGEAGAATEWDTGDGSTYRVLLDGAPLPTTERVEAEPAADETAVLSAVSGGPKESGSGAAGAPPPAAEVAVVDGTADPEDIPDDAFVMRPRWPSLASVETGENPVLRAASTAEDQVSSADELDEDEEDERHTPIWLAALYILVLVLAAGVLGLLVWRMATGDLFDDDGGAAALVVSSWLGIPTV